MWPTKLGMLNCHELARASVRPQLSARVRQQLSSDWVSWLASTFPQHPLWVSPMMGIDALVYVLTAVGIGEPQLLVPDLASSFLQNSHPFHFEVRNQFFLSLTREINLYIIRPSNCWSKMVSWLLITQDKRRRKYQPSSEHPLWSLTVGGGGG